MKLKDLKKLLESATDDTEIKVENGEIVIAEPNPIEFKFKVGDKVVYPRLASAGEIMAITEKLSVNGRPCYNLISDNNVNVLCMEDDIHSCILQGITERIKSFEDACEWCNENGFQKLTDALTPTIQSTCDADIIAYLKLRIITAALNEGLEPDEGDKYHAALCPDGSTDCGWVAPFNPYYMPDAICFKNNTLAKYAAKQFRDLYADFFGCKKGGDK